MGFLKFGKNKKEDNSTKNFDMNDINQKWKNAYHANPKVYEKEDGSIFVGFALTEDTDSLFPYFPEEQWAIDGKEIGLWMITIVSLTNPKGGIIGEIEYHEAMNRLEPYILANQDGWVLIRAMTHSELDALFEGLPRKLVTS